MPDGFLYKLDNFVHPVPVCIQRARDSSEYFYMDMVNVYQDQDMYRVKLQNPVTEHVITFNIKVYKDHMSRPLYKAIAETSGHEYYFL